MGVRSISSCCWTNSPNQPEVVTPTTIWRDQCQAHTGAARVIDHCWGARTGWDSAFSQLYCKSTTASSQLWTRECADFPGQRPERGRTSWPGSTFISKRFLVATLFWQRAITNHFIAEALKSITEIQKFSISLPASVRRHHLSPCCVWQLPKPVH